MKPGHPSEWDWDALPNWEELHPGDLLKWANLYAGDMELVLIIAIEERDGQVFGPSPRVLCLTQTKGLSWLEEFDLLDSIMLNR